MDWRSTAFVIAVLGAGGCAGNPPPASTPPITQPQAGNQAGLYFDPQGADFTLWITTFKDEVYRNWIVPQADLSRIKGHVDYEFTVERNGSISALRWLRSTVSPALDGAARKALTMSHFAALPPDYKPARVRMQVTFFYDEVPPRR
jgi:TonB family protein